MRDYYHHQSNCFRNKEPQRDCGGIRILSDLLHCQGPPVIMYSNEVGLRLWHRMIMCGHHRNWLGFLCQKKCCQGKHDGPYGWMHLHCSLHALSKIRTKSRTPLQYKERTPARPCRFKKGWLSINIVSIDLSLAENFAYGCFCTWNENSTNIKSDIFFGRTHCIFRCQVYSEAYSDQSPRLMIDGGGMPLPPLFARRYV